MTVDLQYPFLIFKIITAMFIETKVTEIYYVANYFCKKMWNIREIHILEERYKNRNKPIVVFILFHLREYCCSNIYQEN